MVRVRNCVARAARRKRLFELVKRTWFHDEIETGFHRRARNCFVLASRRLDKSWQNAYRGRKEKKRDFRKVFIQRISAAVREHNLNYSTFISAIAKGFVELSKMRSREGLLACLDDDHRYAIMAQRNVSPDEDS